MRRSQGLSRSSRPSARANARAQAMETPTIAFAPGRDLSGVPSRSMSAASSSARPRSRPRCKPPQHPVAREPGLAAGSCLARLAPGYITRRCSQAALSVAVTATTAIAVRNA